MSAKAEQEQLPDEQIRAQIRRLQEGDRGQLRRRLANAHPMHFTRLAKALFIFAALAGGGLCLAAFIAPTVSAEAKMVLAAAEQKIPIPVPLVLLVLTVIFAGCAALSDIAALMFARDCPLMPWEQRQVDNLKGILRTSSMSLTQPSPIQPPPKENKLTPTLNTARGPLIQMPDTSLTSATATPPMTAPKPMMTIPEGPHWYQEAFQQAQQLAARYPIQANLRFDDEPELPFTLVMERATPATTIRAMMEFTNFLARIATPPFARIELVAVVQMDPFFYRNVVTALDPHFRGEFEVEQHENVVDIQFLRPDPRWNDYAARG